MNRGQRSKCARELAILTQAQIEILAHLSFRIFQGVVDAYSSQLVLLTHFWIKVLPLGPSNVTEAMILVAMYMSLVMINTFKDNSTICNPEFSDNIMTEAISLVMINK